MATYSRVTYTGTGSAFNASFSFPYLNQSDIYVYVNGVSVPFTFLNTSTVTPTAIPAAGAVVQVRRDTQKITSPVNFTDGSVILEKDLDLLSTYSLYLAQEASDAVTTSITLNTSNLFDAQGVRLVNVANPVDLTDAVNRQYFESVYTPLLDAKVTSVAASATTATTQAGIATVQAAASAASAALSIANSANVTAVAGISGAVSAVNANATNINAVNANKGNIDTAVANLPALSGKVGQTSTTGSAQLPTGTQAQRDASPIAGSLRFNSDVNKPEVYNGTSWGSVGGGATGGMVNRIINGAMVIDQRNAGASVTANDGVFAVDRFKFVMFQVSKGTGQQSTTAPTGFTNSLLFTSSSAYTVGAAENFNIAQYLEGFNVADLAWGTASAQSITLSFWVRSSLTGTFGGSVANGAATRSYPFTFTISAANTFEYKTVTIAGDTSGAWVTNSGLGLRLFFGLGCGASASGTAGAWSSTLYLSATGATSVVGTSGATFYITGVQLEKGSTATSFDYRPYGTELALCQRYFQTVSDRSNTKGSYYSINAGRVSGNLAPPMRSAPTTTLTGTSYEYVGIGAVTGTNGAVASTTTGYFFDSTSLSNGVNFAQLMYLGQVSLSAEL